MQVPKLDKIVINMGVGEAKENAKVLDSAVRDPVSYTHLDNYLYYKGKLQKATDGQKYVCYRVDNKNYVVNSSGKVMKSTKVKNSDGVKFVTNASGQLTSADEDTDIDSYVTEPMEPYCTED